MKLYTDEIPQDCYHCPYFQKEEDSYYTSKGYCMLALDDVTGTPDGLPQNHEQALNKEDCPLIPLSTVKGGYNGT